MKRLNYSISAVLILGLMAFVPTLKAQLHVDASGNIGLGTTSTNAKLDVRAGTNFRTTYLYNDYTGATSKYGVYNYLSSNGTGSRYGIYNLIYSNTASSTHIGLYNVNYLYNTSTGYGHYNYTYCYEGNGTRYGIYNTLGCGTNCGTGIKYALYSSIGTCAGAGNYAGYFNGDVYVAGSITSTSDAAKKTNISDFAGALSIISSLKPKTYNYKQDPDLALPTEQQYGFLAQELEQVLPELVKTVETMSESEPNKEGEVEPIVTGEIKTINYIALIPILVQGMQEQQATIAQQQQRISELEAKVSGR